MAATVAAPLDAGLAKFGRHERIAEFARLDRICSSSISSELSMARRDVQGRSSALVDLPGTAIAAVVSQINPPPHRS